MAGRRLTKKAYVPNNQKPGQASSRARRTSAVRPPNGPLNSHPIDETTRRLIKAVARRASRSNRHVSVTEVSRSDTPVRHDVLPQGPSYIIWNDPEARMLRAGEIGDESHLPLPPRGDSAERQEPPCRAQDDRGGQETRGGGTDEQPARPSNLLRRPSQKLERPLSSLRSKYRAGETQNHAPLPVSLRAPPPSVNLQSPLVKSGGAVDGASAQGPEDGQPTQHRPRLRHRASQRLLRTASTMGRRLSSSCGSSINSDGDEAPAAGQERPEETDASRVRELFDRTVPGHRRRGPCPTNIWW